MHIYFDNAASTKVDEEVLKLMYELQKTNFGNPSSIHHFGRNAKSLIEKSRRTIANYFSAAPSEIFFTSGGTEAINMAISACVNSLKITKVITSKLEHQAVLQCLESYEKMGLIELNYLNFDEKANLNFDELNEFLSKNPNSLVALMHLNNEISNLLPIKKVSKICKKHKAIFLSDTVQSIGHYQLNLETIEIDFIVGSAHKFHGPKGVGFIYVNNNMNIKPLIIGGAQERNMRAGTENVIGIAGMAKALEIAYEDFEKNAKYISGLKNYFVERIKKEFLDCSFLGESEEKGAFTILNVVFPKTEKSEMLMINLDIDGIAVSEGSACTSGSSVRSHVVEALGLDENKQALRFSFSKFNTMEEIDICIDSLKKYLSA
ncbi:MAG: cysteine desulfurase [Bacteroidetes bacterium]|jgi:cysteine desulfurase|nr:cysteine desulfurase [Bacteroidota bacterium]MBT6686587.1 cysteine desulfurase [Bacteroidota bacterium]MBT7144258.1 cysteine desulfurase [Bacteroidota bacterium]MBT7493187.1 cysteine desulfurase [Bacteroidota bacterium]